MKYLSVVLFSLSCLFVSVGQAQTLGGDFSLTDQNGQAFELQQVRGKVVLLFFGFTHCPSVCPDSLAKIKAALNNQTSDQAVALFITVDPERDTAERIKAYLEPFGKQFIGLTGSTQAIQQVLAAYQIRVKAMKKSAEDQDYMLEHTADIYVLDRAGKISNLIPYGLPTEHLQQVLQAQLSEQQSIALSTASPKVEANPPELNQWRVTDLAEQEQTLAQFKGQSLVINFWASWCPPCRKELPSLNQAHTLLKDENIQMLAVNLGDKPKAIKQFLADYPIDFIVWSDENATSFKAWSLQGLPTTLLIQADGKVAERIVGERNWTDPVLLKQMRALAP